MESVVIVGQGLRLPGAQDAGAFWNNVIAGKTEFQRLPPERWPDASDSNLLPRRSLGDTDRITTDIGCFVDPRHLTPRPVHDEVAQDPMFALLGSAGHDAWASAKIDCVDASRVQVIVGNILLPTAACASYAQSFFKRVNWAQDTVLPTLGEAEDTQVGGLPAIILARSLGLQGAAYTLDAACASSLYALKLGCDALLTDAADVALVGGLNRADSFYTQVGFSALGALSSRGRCTPFDSGADGLIVGEGCAMFVCKRASDALAAGDRILAHVAGIGLSNDLGGSLMAPESDGQLRAMRSAYDAAGWEPTTIELYECHGTGTPVGDATELASLRRLWGTEKPGASAVLGSVKGNIGHLLTGAGAASLAKTLLALEHSILPPTAGFTTAGHDLGPFEILRSPRTRSSSTKPMRAAVSAFGFGGINAHVLLEAHDPKRPKAAGNADPQFIVRPTKVRDTRKAIAIVGVGACIGALDGRPEVVARWCEDASQCAAAVPTNWMGHPLAEQYPGYYLESVSLPSHRLSTPPKELEQSLIQQLISLRVALEACDDAGLKRNATPLVGVYVGTNLDLNTTNYTIRWNLLAEGTPSSQLADLHSLNANRTMGGLGSISASRVARALQAGGPAYTVSSGEASGLTALARAVNALRNEEIDYAVTVAVDMAGDPRTVLARETLNPDAEHVWGEGAMALVLMRQSDADEDNKQVYCLIDGVEESTSVAEKFLQTKKHHQQHGYCGAADGLIQLSHTAARLSPGNTNTVTAASNDGAQVSVEIRAPLGAVSWARPNHQSNGNTLQVFPNRPEEHFYKSLSAVPEIPSTKDSASVRNSVQSSDNQQALLGTLSETQLEVGRAHSRFLQVSNGLASTISRLSELAAMGTNEQFPQASRFPNPLAHVSSHVVPSSQGETGIPTALDREQCLEFATGRIGSILGPRFAPLDELPSRVRLPNEPLMLVDRITEIDAEALSMLPGRLVTEHDIAPAAWYLDGGRIPTSLSIEAGQADLFLSAYLGIDFETQGTAVYRLLDAAVTFDGPLPRPGDCLRYDIRITNFFQLGSTHMFRFEFDGTVDGRVVLRMRDGCAGFFSAEELERGRGLLASPNKPIADDSSTPLAWDLAARPLSVEHFDAEQLDALREGGLVGCFGSKHGHDDSQSFVPLPGKKMRLIHRVTQLTANGGIYGLGLVVGETDIKGDEWFLTCHFIDDEVMPGTLMYECCLHTLRVFLLRYGWTGPLRDKTRPETTLCFEPVAGITSRLRCRGQVTASANTVQYQIHIRSLGYNHEGEGQAIADAVMCVDGRPIVHMENLCVQLSGVSHATLIATWNRKGQGPVFSHEQVLEFASGQPSLAFGPAYAPFDEERRLARLPRPPYNFLHRVVSVEGCQAWELRPGGHVKAEYDAGPEEWYANEYITGPVPYAIILEIALQACGWLAAYLGSALTEDVDLSFRNLGGTATVHQPVFVDQGPVTLETSLSLLDVSRAAQMTIQRYKFHVASADGMHLTGETTFGFFTATALEDQNGLTPGIWNAVSTTSTENVSATECTRVLELATGRDRLRLLDTLEISVHPSSENVLERLRATAKVKPGAWFFAAHFYQDPVCPGSLGLEAFIQLLRAAAIRRWGCGTGWGLTAQKKHRWTYRGQILPTNHEYAIEATVVHVDNATQTLEANGILSIDGLDIYLMEGFTIGPVDRPENR